MVGTAMSKLRCGHAFHNYCIARRLEEDKCCSTCRRPAKPRPPPIEYKFEFCEHVENLYRMSSGL